MKFEATGVLTVRFTTVVSTVVPAVPVTVIGYVPVAAFEATVKVSVEVPVPVIEPGLNPTVTPVGSMDVTTQPAS